MLNRVIYNGVVYYKVADLAELFDVSVYKMRKAIKEKNIGEKLKGFGRMVFVSEENVALISVNCKTAVVKTDIKEVAADVFVEANDGHTKAGKQKTKKVKLPAKQKVEQAPEQKVEVETIVTEHEILTKTAQELTKQYANAGKLKLANEISYKHMGEGFVLANSTLKDIEPLRLAVAELENEFTKLNEVEMQI
ncbi:hypothetical protein [Priestia megaterium]|uniref:hypothetical protein n=1 Tax=Priestia megaterium TaxID=1404 RepID=UPI002E1CA760|nr:hypothetical protein [Priestia megaterium]MED4278296.1 hypothetical protein [Priestia megaterium]MED4314401.1 hypothetical protein [Priestia megaterium]